MDATSLLWSIVLIAFVVVSASSSLGGVVVVFLAFTVCEGLRERQSRSAVRLLFRPVPLRASCRSFGGGSRAPCHGSEQMQRLQCGAQTRSGHGYDDAEVPLSNQFVHNCRYLTALSYCLKKNVFTCLNRWGNSDSPHSWSIAKASGNSCDLVQFVLPVSLGCALDQKVRSQRWMGFEAIWRRLHPPRRKGIEERYFHPFISFFKGC